MFCGKCGFGNDSDSMFCGKCGASFNAPMHANVASRQTQPNFRHPAKKRMSTNTKIIIGSVGVVFLALIVLIIIIFTTNNSERPLVVSEMLEIAERYLLEGNYEQALVEFIRIIEVEPREPRGYTGAAEAFVGMDQIDDATDILRQGLTRVPDETIAWTWVDVAPYDEQTYLDIAELLILNNEKELATEILLRGLENLDADDIRDRLIELGVISASDEHPYMAAAFAAYYAILREYIENFGGIVVPFETGTMRLSDGIHFAGLFDFDGDGLPELLINGPDRYHYRYYDEHTSAGFGHIYSFSPETGAVKLYAASMSSGGLAANTFPFWVEISEDGRAYLVTSYSVGWPGQAEHFSTLVDGNMVVVMVRHPDAEDWSSFDNDNIVFYVNGVRVSEEEYKNAPMTELGIMRSDDYWQHLDSMWDNPDSVHATLALLSGGNMDDYAGGFTSYVRVGDIIEFGNYEWRVLDVQGERALVITHRIIESRAYHNTFEDITWADSDMRYYLNFVKQILVRATTAELEINIPTGMNYSCSNFDKLHANGVYKQPHIQQYYLSLYH